MEQPDFLQTCPCCGQPSEPRCEIPGCTQVADWEGWVRRTPMIIKMLVCHEHQPELIGYKEKDNG
jgi:hypothetical protein